jgi:hypothetical protein
MSAPEEFYTADRWNNWIDRIDDTDLDPDDEDSARLLLNAQDDTAIAVAKIVAARDEGEIDDGRAMEELETLRSVVLSDPELEDEETAMLVDGVQTSLVCVVAAAEEYLAGGPAEDGTPEEYVTAAADAEDDDPDAALGYCVQAGTQLLDGAELDMAIVEEIEYGLVAEWVNGLDSLQNALRDPEVVEDE